MLQTLNAREEIVRKEDVLAKANDPAELANKISLAEQSDLEDDEYEDDEYEDEEEEEEELAS